MRLLILLAPALLASEPIRLHPDNPHYYLFRGKPTILLTSAEHYGAVLNGEFNYLKYLDTLKADRLNLTRAFSGVYREVPGDFGITRNTLAPADVKYVSPYARGASGKFDLKRWNPAYWERLKKFIEAAGARGIVVEYTLFCVYYQDRMWDLAPWKGKNNGNGIGEVPRGEVLTLKHAALVAAQEEFVKKAVLELNGYDNLLFEICNEPYVTGVPDDWQRHMAKALHDAEGALPNRHLIGQNIANNTKKVEDPDENVSFLNFHYARPPVAVAQNYGLKRVIGLDETGFDGTLDAIYRFQAWDFLMAGGAHYNNLDYSFVVGHEDGSFLVPGTAPGGGSAGLRKQLSVTADFFDKLDFVHMAPAPDLVLGGLPEGFTARALADAGKTCAVYLHSGRLLQNYRPRYVYRTDRQAFPISLNLPAGRWKVEWWNTRSGAINPAESLDHAGGQAWIASPEFTEDIAVVLRRQ